MPNPIEITINRPPDPHDTVYNLASITQRVRILETGHYAFIGREEDSTATQLFFITAGGVFVLDNPVECYEVSSFFVSQWIRLEINVYPEQE